MALRNMALPNRIALTLVAAVLVLTACRQPHQDGLPTVSEFSNPGGPGARYPFVVAGGAGESVQMSWLEGDTDTMNLLWASFDGSEWTTPELIRSSDQFFVNWADFPSIAIVNEKPVAAHWPQKVEGSTYAYHVNVSFRSDQGEWTAPVTPHADRSPSEHGFASMLPVDSGQVFAVWLDGYQTEEG
ncbi:MAG: hypothetical protein R3330_16985, partial [Saprospiraceae bacterium]|nr:hypothetical protein [Saprospiraceae bacterium]